MHLAIMAVYRVSNSRAETDFVIITAAGAGGGPGPLGSDGPSWVYKHLAKNKRAVVIRIQYSDPRLSYAVFDTYGCIRWAHTQFPSKPIIIIGWSMGGAAIINAIYHYTTLHENHDIKGFITLAGQSKRTTVLSHILNIPKFYLHGDEDTSISLKSLKLIFNRSQEPKFFQILKSNDHSVIDAYPLITKFIDLCIGNK